jgi:hypothetical protein
MIVNGGQMDDREWLVVIEVMVSAFRVRVFAVTRDLFNRRSNPIRILPELVHVRVQSEPDL